MTIHYYSSLKEKTLDNTKCWWRYGATVTHTLLVGIKTGTAYLENILTVSYKYTLTRSSRPSPRYIPKRNKDMSIKSST